MSSRTTRAALWIGGAAVLAAGAFWAATTRAAAPQTVRVLVYHDMEGLAGQNDPQTYRFIHREKYALGQKMLVADLNAVIAGLFDGGATVVHVVDAHGSGNPEPDVITADLDPRAKQLFRDAPFHSYDDVVAPNQYDAVVAVGMHAKTGSRGFAAHTYTIGMELRLNGTSITESELVAFSWGRVDVPMIMVTGDDKLKQDLATMPWLQYVVTKTATAADSAILRPVDEVHTEMRAAAKLAVEGRAQAKVMKLEGPITAALHAVPPASLRVLDGVPGITYRDNTVEFVAQDFKSAYRGLVALIGVATQSYSGLYREMFSARSEAEARALSLEYSDRLFQRWMDVESGRWQAPTPPTPAARKYHGAN